MQIKTILNRVQKFKSFVYGAVRWIKTGALLALEVDVLPRANGQGICSGCGCCRPGYDRLPTRRFEFGLMRGSGGCQVEVGIERAAA